MKKIYRYAGILLLTAFFYLATPFAGLFISERFAISWEGEYWVADGIQLCSTMQSGKDRLTCYCSVVKVHLREPEEGVLVPDLPLLPLLRNRESHCDQMAWVLGMMTVRAGYKSRIIHWPERTHTAIEVDAGDGYHLLDPFTGYLCNSDSPYPVSAASIREADSLQRANLGWNEYRFPNLTILSAAPEYIPISNFSIRWFWIHRVWSWLPQAYHNRWRKEFHKRFGFV